MPCELTPVVLELFDKAIVRSELLFEITVGMNVNNDRQAMVEDHLHGTVEIAQVFGRNLVGLPVPEHRLRIHSQPQWSNPIALINPISCAVVHASKCSFV